MAVKMQAIADKRSLVKIFETLHQESCPHDYNFHLHTQCSDGSLDPIELFQQAIQYQLKGLAITDHHSVQGYLKVLGWVEDILESSQSSTSQPFPTLWTGIEITATLLATDVHILGFAFDPTHPSLGPYLQGDSVQGALRQAPKVISAIQEANGLAVLAHPARYKKSAEQLIKAAVTLGIDGVETYYCYSNPEVWEPSKPQTLRVQQMSNHYQLLRTAGTDTHGRNILRRL